MPWDEETKDKRDKLPKKSIDPKRNRTNREIEIYNYIKNNKDVKLDFDDEYVKKLDNTAFNEKMKAALDAGEKYDTLANGLIGEEAKLSQLEAEKKALEDKYTRYEKYRFGDKGLQNDINDFTGLYMNSYVALAGQSIRFPEIEVGEGTTAAIRSLIELRTQAASHLDNMNSIKGNNILSKSELDEEYAKVLHEFDHNLKNFLQGCGVTVTKTAPDGVNEGGVLVEGKDKALSSIQKIKDDYEKDYRVAEEKLKKSVWQSSKDRHTKEMSEIRYIQNCYDFMGSMIRMGDQLYSKCHLMETLDDIDKNIKDHEQNWRYIEAKEVQIETQEKNVRDWIDLVSAEKPNLKVAEEAVIDEAKKLKTTAENQRTADELRKAEEEKKRRDKEAEEEADRKAKEAKKDAKRLKEEYEKLTPNQKKIFDTRVQLKKLDEERKALVRKFNEKFPEAAEDRIGDMSEERQALYNEESPKHLEELEKLNAKEVELQAVKAQCEAQEQKEEAARKANGGDVLECLKEMKRLAKALDATKSIGQSNTEGFVSLYNTMKGFLNSSDDTLQRGAAQTTPAEFVAKYSQVIKNACKTYADTHSDTKKYPELDKTQRQRLKVMSRILQVLDFAERGISPNSVEAKREMLAEKFVNAQFIETLKGNNSKEAKAKAREGLLSFAAVNRQTKDKILNTELAAIKSNDNVVELNTLLRKKGASFMKDNLNPPERNTAARSLQ